MSSIIHIGRHNLGANYKNTQYSKDNFYVSTTTNKIKQEKKLDGKRQACYRAISAAGRKCLDIKGREQQSLDLKKRFKNYAPQEETILKVLNAYYYCCQGIYKDKDLKIKADIYSNLQKMSVDSRIIDNVLLIEKIHSSSNTQKTTNILSNNTKNSFKKVHNNKPVRLIQHSKQNVKPVNRKKVTAKQLARLEFYTELHQYLMGKKVSSAVKMKQFIEMCKKRGRSKDDLKRLLVAYQHKKATGKPLKVLNEDKKLGLYSKDIKELDSLW